MTDRPIGVLFVCHANLCRSPLAEGVFRHLAQQRGVAHRFRIDSAGTWGLDGQLPHPLSCQVAGNHGFELSGRSRSIEPEDLQTFDHVLLMDRRNLADVQRYRRLSAFGTAEGQEATIRLLRSVAAPDATDAELDVPDPVGRAIDAYERTYELLLVACSALLEELMS